jgi:hypothetical protein
MAQHSNVMGGSTASRRIHCPGSYLAEKDHPNVESEYAIRGSMLHSAMELLLTADPETMDDTEDLFEQLIGQELGYGDEYEITKELVDTKLRPAWEAWCEVMDEYDLDDWFIEQRVSFGDIIPGAFGTADIIAKDKQKRLHVLDWKFGDGVPVPAEANMGLGFYAGGALYDEDAELQEFCDDISGVVLHIVQPRVGSNVVLHTWETTEEWIELLVEQAASAVALAHDPKAPRIPGDWCMFCKDRVGCPAQQALATAALSNEPKSMTSVELGAAMHMAQQLKSWISDVVKLAEKEAEGGAAIPGWKLVNKRPTRVWTDHDEAEKRLRNAKIKVADMYNRKLISPTQAEKLSKKLYGDKLSDIVVMHSSGLTLVQESDRRQAVVSGAELLANALPEQ